MRGAFRHTVAFMVLVCGLAAAGIPRASAQDPYAIVADLGTTNARFPAAALLLASDGNYYGTAYEGGDNGLGAVFMMTPQGVLTVLHSFDGTDGANPYAPLVEGDDHNLYGTTLPKSGGGTIFRITKQGVLTVVHTLATQDVTGCFPEGTSLSAPLVKGSDALYGVAASGSVATSGICTTSIPFFRVSYAGAFDVIGRVSDYGTTSGLVRGADGNFYGTTDGGAQGQDYGVVYRMSEAGAYTRLHVLTRAEGFAHTGELAQGQDGAFYGTARAGGAASPTFEGGTVFRFAAGADETSSTYTTLYSFVENDPAGSEPYAGLVQGSDGLLYGTTSRTGANASTAGNPGGHLFSITTKGTVTPLVEFDAVNGYQPMGELIQPSPGRLLGTTAFGGSGLNAGVVFSYTFGLATTTTLGASPSTSVFGQQVILTADVSSNTATPTGQVQLFDGATGLGFSALNGGVATLATSSLGVGSHTLRADYTGEDGFLSSTSPPVTVTVSRAATGTALSSSANPAARRQSITVRATVTAVAPGAGLATGQVRFLEGKKKLATAALVNGIASVPLSFTSAGQHVLTAIYGGDSRFTGSTAAPFTLTITK